MFEKVKINRIKNVETAIVLAILILFIAWKHQDWRLVIAAVGTLILSLIVPRLFYPIAKIWFSIGVLLGFVTTKILLTILFFFVVSPVGYVRRLIGKDTLSLKKFKKDDSSTFIIRNHKYVSEDLNNPF